MLKNEDGVWVDDVNQLKTMERAFFHKLYTKEELYEQFLVHGDFSKLTNDELLLLGKEVSKNEIKYAFFCYGKLEGSWSG